MIVVYVFVLIAENKMNAKYVTNAILAPERTQKANVRVGRLKSDLGLSEERRKS